MQKAILAISAAVALVPAPLLSQTTTLALASEQRSQQAERIYDKRGRYLEPRTISRNSYVWEGDKGRYYCRRDNGTTGLVVGEALGAFAGHELAGEGDKTLGAILGAFGGGMLGQVIDQGELKCR